MGVWTSVVAFLLLPDAGALLGGVLIFWCAALVLLMEWPHAR